LKLPVFITMLWCGTAALALPCFKTMNIVIFFLSVIVGGALGNIIDRIRFKAVADFFDFHIAGYHWPAFNIADSFVFIGAFGLIGYTLFFGSNENEKSK